jgi:hypothetical protein
VIALLLASRPGCTPARIVEPSDRKERDIFPGAAMNGIEGQPNFLLVPQAPAAFNLM